ncbi:hypothetical protein KR018_007418, partial [Drosophila ironensis]
KRAPLKRSYRCGMCLEQFPGNHLATKRHEQECEARLRRLFVCRQCLTLCGDEARLRRHRERRHRADRRCLCLQCGKRYASAAFLYRHVASWHGLHALFYCALCEDGCQDARSFGAMQALQDHAREVHDLGAVASEADETEELEMLEECIEDMPSIEMADDFTFDWPLDLDKAACIGNGKPSVFVCPVCANGFSGSSSLITHLRKSHQRDPLECCFCGKLHATRDGLRSHLQRVHVLVRQHICDVCQADFATADHLRKHMNSLHLGHRPFKCHLCPKVFAQRSHLQEHIKTDRGHKDAQQFVCQLCQWPFFRAIDLERHVNKWHP